MADTPHLVIADGHALCYQAFYALPPMSAPDGRPTQVVYGVLSVLFKLLKTLKPTAFIVAFDAPGPTFRHKAFAEYKIQRAPAPEGLHAQIDLLKEVLASFPMAQMELKGYEADDLLGTLAEQATVQGHKVTLVTMDKDALQLISDRVVVYNPRKDARIGVAELAVERGLTPAQVPDYLALTGDASDNVPGVPGVGPKTAVKLLAAAGSLEALLAHPDAHAKGKVAEALRDGEAQARASLALATIDRKAPVTFEPGTSRPPSRLAPAAREMMKSLGFHRFLSEFPAEAPASLFAEAESPIPAPKKVEQDWTRASRPLVLEGAWTAEPLASGELMLIGPKGEAILADPSQCRAGTTCDLAAHDLKAVLLRMEGAHPSRSFDTLLASYLLDPESTHRLEDLAREHLQRELPLPPSGRKAEPETPDAAAGRAAARARAVRDLAPVLRERLKAAGLDGVLEEIELPLVPILAAMEKDGIGLDKPTLAAISQELGARLAALEGRIHAEAGHPFTIGSPKQLAQVLFEELKLPHGRKGKTGYSTDAEVLEELAPVHPLPALLLEYRQLDKLKNTYVDALPELVGADGRLHTSFNQAVAATGRLSSSRPNLQNIPIRTEAGRRIRDAFRPHGPGDLLLTADYSQIELRVLAHCSGDPDLRAAFAEGQDIHAVTAAQIHGVAVDAVTDAQRGFAKAVNFGVIYGQGAYTLAKSLGRPQKEAQAFIDAYFARFAGVKAFIDRTVAGAKASGKVTTLSGRIRPVPFLASPNPAQRAAAERIAVNTVIQGSAADLIKLAMIRVAKALEEGGSEARILLQIHDELVLNVPKPDLEKVRETVVACMTGAMRLTVPLVVNTASGETWREAA